MHDEGDGLSRCRVYEHEYEQEYERKYDLAPARLATLVLFRMLTPD